jgi:uncharacterized protein (DUF779 family)
VQVRATDRVVDVVARARDARAGRLTITIGTGCCESTAPFLYEDFWPGPDQQVVGEVAGVEVYAPEYLRRMYPGDDGVVIDVYDGIAESMSIETEWDCRLFLRGHGVDVGSEPGVCAAPADESAGGGSDARAAGSGSDARAAGSGSDAGPGLLATRSPGSFVKGELPEALRHPRVR